MADKRFFNLSEPMSLGDIAKLTGSVLSDEALSDKIISDVVALDDARNEHLSFLDNRKYVESFKSTKAGACFVQEELATLAPAGTVCLINKNPYKAYAIAAQAFYFNDNTKEESVSENAVIDKSASIGSACLIEAGVVIGANVKIGDNCKVKANSVIGDGVEIGDNCNIGANVSITHALLDSNVHIYSGVRIGCAGFGFAIDLATGFTSVPQLGRVIIESDVEIGANTTIDRGAGPDTVIGQGTRIDNLVQIGHNVKIGKYCILVAQSGVAGSTKLGDYVVVGGQAAISGHLNIGSGVRIAGKSGVMRDIPAEKGKEYMGTPAVPLKQHMRQLAMLAKMAKSKVKNKKD